MPKVIYQLDFTVQVWEESETFVAHAMPLDIMSHGDTPGEARDALDEAVTLFFKTAQEMGTLHDVLEESGYAYDGTSWKCPSLVSTVQRTFSIARL